MATITLHNLRLIEVDDLPGSAQVVHADDHDLPIWYDHRTGHPYSVDSESGTMWSVGSTWYWEATGVATARYGGATIDVPEGFYEVGYENPVIEPDAA